jgi:hypothetical protein
VDFTDAGGEGLLPEDAEGDLLVFDEPEDPATALGGMTGVPRAEI